MTKSEILFELRNYIHFLLPDDFKKIFEGEVERIVDQNDRIIVRFINTKYRYVCIHNNLSKHGEGSIFWFAKTGGFIEKVIDDEMKILNDQI